MHGRPSQLKTATAKLKPLQFVYFDQQRNLVLNQQVAKLIVSFQQKVNHITVLSVVGRYRTGKSYILNRVLLNQSSGFEVGPTINACTKGLWVWPQLVEIQGPDGQNKLAMVMDTEGLGSLEEGENTDVKIFLMSTLLSSFMIYNSMGTIDEKALQGLGLIVNLSKILHKSQHSADSHELVNCFPSFLWLVRDFALRLENDKGQAISSTDYLENALKPQKGRPELVDSKNSIRSQLRQFFKERDCYTLIRPTANEKDLQTLNMIPQNRLRPEFVSAVKKLKTLIFDRLKPKHFKNKPCSPVQYIEMVRLFIKAINEGGIPSISSNWDSVCTNESNKIIELYSKNQEDEIQKLLLEEQPLSAIEKVHKGFILEGQSKIDKTFLPALDKQLKKKALKKRLKEGFEVVRKELVEKNFKQIQQSLEQTFIALMKDVRINKIDNFVEVCSKLQDVRFSDEKKITDVSQEDPEQPRLYLQLYHKLKNLSSQFIDAMQEKWRTQQELLKDKQALYESTYQQRKAQMQNQLDQVNDKLRNYEVENYRLSIQLDALKQDKINLTEELKTERIRLQITEDTLAETKAAYDEKALECRAMITEINSMLARTSKASTLQLQQQILIYEGKIHSMTNEMRNLETHHQFIKNENEDLRDRIEKLEHEVLNAQLLEGTKEFTAKIMFLTKQNQNLSRQLDNQKSINQTLVRTLQPQTTSTIALLNQIKNIEAENTELLSTIKQLKFYQQVVLSCSQFRCSKCDGLHRYDQFASHSCQPYIPPQFDVSFGLDSFTKQLVFNIQVIKGQLTWKLQKSKKHINHFLKKLNMDELVVEDSAESYESCRQHIIQVLEKIKDELRTNNYLNEFLAIDIHTARTRMNYLTVATEIIADSEGKSPREGLMESCGSPSDMKLSFSSSSQDNEQNDLNYQNFVEPGEKKVFLKTCRFDMKKTFRFP